MKQRRLTVSRAYYDSEFGEPHPLIRLRGRWLAEAGFAIGSRVTVTADRGIIVIVADREPGQPSPTEGQQRMAI